VGLNGILSHIVKGILDEPDIRVLAELPLERWSAAKVDEAEADVLILASEDRSLSLLREVLRARPLLKVLTVRNDGRDTSLFELRPHETDLGQVSPETLLTAVRTARTAPL
jgi:hypothetical protein